MNIKNISLWAIIAIVSFGCGGSSSIMMKPDAMKNVKRIAVVEMKEPLYYMMDLSSGTPWGAIAEKNRAEEIKPKFVGILKKEKFSLKKYLTQEVHRSLRKAGFKTSQIKVKRGEKHAFLTSYDKYKNIKADVLLEIVPYGAGYVVQQPFAQSYWRPTVEALVRVVDSRSGAILYQEKLMYGYHNAFISAVDLDAPKKFQYDNREDIFKAGNKKIISGLKDGVQKISKYLGKHFRK